MTLARNKVLLVLTLVGATAILTSGFVTEAPNRLVSGQALALWQVANSSRLAVVALLGLSLFGASFVPATRPVQWTTAALATALLLLLLYAAGAAAATLAAQANPAARTSLGAGFWLAGLCAGLAVVDALQRLAAGPGVRFFTVVAIFGAIAGMAAAGLFDALSLVREYEIRQGAFLAALGQHCELVLGTLGPALLIGVPLGVAAARRPKIRPALFSVLNLLQTIPSVALFGLLIAPLSALSAALPALRAIGVHGIGFAPAILALVLYSLLPVVRNTEAGIAAVDPAVIETGDGMGFTRRQRLWRIEAPLGLSVFLAGLRIVVVQAIGLAVVAALVGAGGLGTFVFQGLGQYAVDLVLLGAVPTILMALAADFLLGLLITLVGGSKPP